MLTQAQVPLLVCRHIPSPLILRGHIYLPENRQPARAEADESLVVHQSVAKRFEGIFGVYIHIRSLIRDD